MAEPNAPPPPAPEKTQKMYDRATGAAYDVPLSQVREAYTSRRLSFLEGQKIQVAGADGKIDEVDASEADKLFSSAASAGSSLSTPGALREQQLQDSYGGVGGGALAFGSRALSSATLGLSDAAITGAADFVSPNAGSSVREALTESQARNEGAAFTGDIVGMAATALATGGASAAGEVGMLARGARALSAPARLATGVGEAAGAGVRALAGESTAARIAASGVAGAGEQALQGFGVAVREASLRDEPLTAESLAAAGMNAAVFGGAIGLGAGALGAGARALGAVARGGAERVFGAGRSLAGDVEAGGLLARAREAAADVVERAKGVVEGKADDAIAKRADELVELITGRPVGQTLDDFATASALRSTGATGKRIERLAAYGDEALRSVRDTTLDDLAPLVGKERGSLLSKAEKSQAASLLRKQEGRRLGAVVKEADEIARGLSAEGIDVRPDYARLVADVREVAEEYAAVAGASEEASLAKKIARDVEKKWNGMGLEAIHRQRAFLDKKLRNELKAGSSTKAEVYEKVRDRIEGWIVASGDRIAKEGGGEFAARYQASKVRFARAAWLEEATSHGAGQARAAGVLMFRDQVGALLGSSLLGGGPFGILGGAAGYLGQRWMREYGDQAVAQIARDAAVDGSLRGAVQSIRERVRRGVSSALESGRVKAAAGPIGEAAAGALDLAKGAASAVAGAARATGQAVASGARAAGRGASVGARAGASAAYRWHDDRERAMARSERTARAVTAYASEPDAIHGSAAPGLREARPDLNARVAATNARAAEYLASEQPRSPLPPGPLRPRDSRAPVDEVEGFERKAKATKDPTSVVKFTKNPSLASSDSLAAVQAVYPELRQVMRQDAAEAAIRHAGTVDYKTAIRLSRVAGTALEPSCDPGFGATLQEIYAAADERAAQGPSPRQGASGRSLMAQQSQPGSSRLQEWERR